MTELIPPAPAALAADFREVATELESEIAAVEAAVGRLGLVRKEAEGALVAKRKAIDTLRRTLLWVGRTTEGLFHLAGESELAERIRKSARRPPRPSEQGPAAEPPAEDPAAEPASEALPVEDA